MDALRRLDDRVLLAITRLGVIAAILAKLLAFARVYIGAHYPWGVLTGGLPRLLGLRPVFAELPARLR